VPGCALLVNNAGGAIGLEPIERADIGAWQAMYETNVLGTLRMTRALLPSIIASGDGHVIIVGSVAAYEAYPGGGGYNAAKFAERAVASVLRQELLGQPVRVTEVDPGLVETDFSLVRFRGDPDRAAQVYEDVTPLTADDVAECIVFAATRPSHVNIDSLAVLARDQAGARQIHRHPT
jgi:NADP-dependent 3-hydroxy acid dehydrogenase YdfG